MKTTLLRAQCCAIGILLTLSPFLLAKNKFPSTEVALVLTGFAEIPADLILKQQYPTVEAVENWEDDHAEMVFGSDRKGPHSQKTIGYMYPQSIGYDPGDFEFCLKRESERTGWSYEDLFLHFSEDTVLKAPNAATIGSRTSLGGIPFEIGNINFKESLGQSLKTYEGFKSPSWGEGLDQDIYIFSFEHFNEINLAFNKEVLKERFSVEYLTKDLRLDSKPVWIPVDDLIHEVKPQSHMTLHWPLPNDWQREVPVNPNTGEKLTFYRDDIQKNPIYVARIRSLVNKNFLTNLKDAKLKRWILPISDNELFVPGWDSKNDLNQDGVIDQDEWVSRRNLNASARTKTEARVIPTGRMGNPVSSDGRTNLALLNNRNLISFCLAEKFNSENLLGGYNDDYDFMLGSNVFDIVSGGAVLEYDDDLINSAKSQKAYHQDLNKLYEEISAYGFEYIAANIAENNAYLTRIPSTPEVNTLLREFYLYPGIGLDGWGGLLRKWDLFATTAEGKKSVVMTHHKKGRAQLLENNEENWLDDKETALAVYYLFNIPSKTFYATWNASWRYGSGNTQKKPSSYWKSGVPKNMAYLPVDLLHVDMGSPKKTLMRDISVPTWVIDHPKKIKKSDYKTSSSSIFFEVNEKLIEKEVTPTNWFYIYSSEEKIAGVPIDAVLAREYTNGLVLYRTSNESANKSFYLKKNLHINLPSCYARVTSQTGSKVPSKTILIGGYEGVLLKKSNLCSS